MENWLYLGAGFTDFDSKTRFGKDIILLKSSKEISLI
jgi:hypothetical protein